MTYRITGADPDALADLLHRCVDHAGNRVAPFEDDDGGWALRCCLTDSVPGDQIAVVAFSPFPWRSAYAETGPVVVHVAGCPGPPDGTLPPQFHERRQVLRVYGHDRRQAYDLHRVVEPGGLAEALEALVADERVECVHARNVVAGCWSFAATAA
ncbi:DUF1203 domain-containing protein [Nocardioides anomalus]|uniref:DUF1203 domain-containing protein n=1 Tax=Nocardioides anomalus TaxID=2712223 RepID=A0A6G6WIN3_9ACTN|nr:DUF1203 domain-containing protein [Nocardioides anomalus]QIG45017.1 DUF1203 domain-containing protein [Nocardioides anomalus]